MHIYIPNGFKLTDSPVFVVRSVYLDYYHYIFLVCGQSFETSDCGFTIIYCTRVGIQHSSVGYKIITLWKNPHYLPLHTRVFFFYYFFFFCNVQAPITVHQPRLLPAWGLASLTVAVYVYAWKLSFQDIMNQACMTRLSLGGAAAALGAPLWSLETRQAQKEAPLPLPSPCKFLELLAGWRRVSAAAMGKSNDKKAQRSDSSKWSELRCCLWCVGLLAWIGIFFLFFFVFHSWLALCFLFFQVWENVFPLVSKRVFCFIYIFFFILLKKS